MLRNAMEGHTAADQKHGKSLYWAAIVALMLGLTALFQGVTRNNQLAQSVLTSDGEVALVLNRQRDGHYYAEGAINGSAVAFLVDTGASDVALSSAMARSLGLEFGPEITVMTAAGPVRGWITRLDQIQVGPLLLRNVRATITDNLGEQALLGMSFLKHFSMIQEGDTLILAVAAES
ncbi:MAG TPA: TIGR02281 family clan AA aspartic protease [Xanthomonadales bacterium]|nr:TIGR02281 family clan AA aspartic protease [Xanthomonadales bacterium]